MTLNGSSMGTRAGGRRKWAATRAPLLAFALVYVFTCMLGALLMLSGYREFIGLFQYFSGTAVPNLTTAQVVLVLTLLIVAPLYLWLGFEVALWLSPRRIPALRGITTTLASARLESPSWLPLVVFCATTGLAIASIARSGSLHSFTAWFDYHSWVQARAHTFRGVTFVEFVNIYLFEPLAAAWVVVTLQQRGPFGVFLRWAPVAITVAIDLLLFQKKTAESSLLIIVFAWALAAGRSRPRRLRLGAVVTVLVLLTIYFAAVVVPIYSKASGSVCGVQGISCSNVVTKVPAVVLYSALSPLTRTSAPALWYPVIFPRQHHFFPPDVGLDVVGIGRFPDDNLVVWHFLNPGAAGTTVVPFQFTLYSQGGVFVALVGSFVMGFVLALGWRLTLSKVLPQIWSSLLGSMVLLFGVYLAIDSVRNSSIVSYGVCWGLLFIAVAGAVVHFGHNGKRALTSSKNKRAAVQRATLLGDEPR